MKDGLRFFLASTQTNTAAALLVFYDSTPYFTDKAERPEIYVSNRDKDAQISSFMLSIFQITACAKEENPKTSVILK